MSTLRKEVYDHFTVIDNAVFGDNGLTFTARGLLCYLLSKPNDWKILMPDLRKKSGQGEKAITNALQELATAGYLMRVRKRVDNHITTETIISNVPKFLDVGTPDSRIYGYDRQLSDPQESGGSEGEGSQTGGSLVKTDAVKTERVKTDTSKPSNPNTVPIMEAYIEALGYQPTEYAREMKAAKQIAEAGFTPADVAVAYTQKKSEEFWSSKHLSLQFLAKELPAMRQAVLNGRSVEPRSRNNGLNAVMDYMKEKEARRGRDTESR